MQYPGWLQLALQVCFYFMTATPLAIVAWMILRRVRDRTAAIRPGALRLAGWLVMTTTGVFLLMFASGGHRASREVELVATVTVFVMTGVCARMLWTLYRKIGLPRA